MWILLNELERSSMGRLGDGCSVHADDERGLNYCGSREADRFEFYLET